MAGIANGGKKAVWFGLSDGNRDISVASDCQPGRTSRKKRQGKGHYNDCPKTGLRYASSY